MDAHHGHQVIIDAIAFADQLQIVADHAVFRPRRVKRSPHHVLRAFTPVGRQQARQGDAEEITAFARGQPHSLIVHVKRRLFRRQRPVAPELTPAEPFRADIDVQENRIVMVAGNIAQAAIIGQGQPPRPRHDQVADEIHRHTATIAGVGIDAGQSRGDIAAVIDGAQLPRLIRRRHHPAEALNRMPGQCPPHNRVLRD